MSLGFIFDEAKAAEAAAYVLSLNGGRLPYLKLIKILYISDRRFLSDYHSSITTSSYYSMPFGPVTSEILDCIKHPEDLDKDGYWNSQIFTEDYDVVLKKEAEHCFLSDTEREVIKDVNEKYKEKDRFSLAEFTHSFPEWKDPGSSRIPLTIEDILEATIANNDERKEAIEDIKVSALIQSINHNKEVFSWK